MLDDGEGSLDEVVEGEFADPGQRGAHPAADDLVQRAGIGRPARTRNAPTVAPLQAVYQPAAIRPIAGSDSIAAQEESRPGLPMTDPGFDSLEDHGFQFQPSTMLVPETLPAHISGSKGFGNYGDPWDARIGLNGFPFRTQALRWISEVP